MPLISCPECTKQISDMAPACPSCGVPVASVRESKGSGTTLNTMQETSKKLKLQSVLSVSLMGLGVILIGATKDGGDPSTAGPLMLGGGLMWFIVNRIRIWWHHK